MPADVALVTGAGSGIGRATTRALHEDGWTVYATDVDADALADLPEAWCTTAQMDVTDAAAVESVVARIREEAGGVDCLVNNAGYGQFGPVEDVPMDRIERQFDVNCFGAIRTTKAVLPGMRARGDGLILNVSSTYGRLPTPGAGAYAGSKHALEGLSDALRMEVAGEGIDVVLLEPAWVATDFAARVRESLDFERSDGYDRLYAALEDGRLVEGGPFAVTPERVAERIRAVAAMDDPDARYTVGSTGRFLLRSRFFPQRLYDWVQRTLVRVLGR